MFAGVIAPIGVRGTVTHVVEHLIHPPDTAVKRVAALDDPDTGRADRDELG